MKKIILSPAVFLLLVLLSILNSCVKDTCKSTYTYTYYTPVYESLAQLKASIKSGNPEEVENPGKIVLLGHYIFLNEIEKGIHIIDNSSPAAPRNISFVKIPGNIDLSVKGNTLYADSYGDLVTLDVSNPLNVILKKYTENVLLFAYSGTGIAYNDQTKIAGWIKKDTTVPENCGGGGMVFYTSGIYTTNALQSSSVPGANISSQVGTSGSMARFAIVNNYLYTVNESNLNIFNIANSDDPEFLKEVTVDYHVETIYPFENELFIGSNNGMFIYNIESSPENPSKAGEFTHARSCDPVIADGQYAYITLHSGTTCLGYNNELDIVQLNNLVDASLVKIYDLSSPRGLSKDGNLLFICDGTDGLKIFNAADVSNIKLIKQFSNFETYDVIAHNGIALVVATDGLYQYDYSDVNNIHLISKISLAKS
ncbi:MAG: hypothetical protein KGM16_00275 [Bacteroidota bacterium]|nr:hypothetical protein [Bacteroidota bacterium]